MSNIEKYCFPHISIGIQNILKDELIAIMSVHQQRKREDEQRYRNETS